MEHAAFLGIVVKALCLFIPQRIARTICGSGNDALDLRSSFDGVMKMENRHSLPPAGGRVFTLKVYKRAFLPLVRKYTPMIDKKLQRLSR